MRSDEKAIVLERRVRALESGAGALDANASMLYVPLGGVDVYGTSFTDLAGLELEYIKLNSRSALMVDIAVVGAVSVSGQYVNLAVSLLDSEGLPVTDYQDYGIGVQQATSAPGLVRWTRKLPDNALAVESILPAGRYTITARVRVIASGTVSLASQMTMIVQEAVV